MSWSSVSRASDDERGSTRLWLAVRLIGAGLLIVTGAIHLDLYLTGYRTIPTIGWLFLLQVIAAFGLGAVMIVWSSRLAAAAGAGFAIATLAGYILSLRLSLFGFREVRTTAGIVAGVIEVATFTVLAAFALRPFSEREDSRRSDSRPAGRRSSAATYGLAGGQLTAFTLVILVALGVSLGAGGPTSTGNQSSRPHLEVRQIHGVSVLTNQRGYTMYWFAPDTIEHVDLLRDLCDLLAARDRHASRGTRRDWQARNDQTNRRKDPSHLRRPSALHLHRRLCSWPVHWQQHQFEWWVLVRDTCVWLIRWFLKEGAAHVPKSPAQVWRKS